MGPLYEADSSITELQVNASVSDAVLRTHRTHIGNLFTIDAATSFLLSHHELPNAVANHKACFCYACKHAKRFVWKLYRTEEEIDDSTVFHEIDIEDFVTDIIEGTEFDHFMMLSVVRSNALFQLERFR